MAEASFTIRAVDATRAAFLNVQNSLAQLKQSSATAAAFMQKVFSPKALGTGLASALGISLVGAIDAAVEALVRFATRFNDVQEIVKNSAKDIAQIYRDAAFEAMEPEQKLTEIARRRRAMEEEIFQLKQKTAVVMKETLALDQTGQVRTVRTFSSEATREEADQLAKVSAELARLNVQADQITTKTAIDKVKQLEDSFDALIAAQKKSNDEAEAARLKFEAAQNALKDAASAQLDMLDPMREYQRQIELVNKLEREGLLNTIQAEQRRQQIKKASAEAINHEINLLREAASAQLDILDPTRQYQREIELVNKLLAAQVLTAEQASQRIAQITGAAAAQRNATQREAASTMRDFEQAQARVYGREISASDEIARLKMREGDLLKELSSIAATDLNGRTEKQRELIDLYRELEPLLEQQTRLARDAGEVIASGFEDAILSGNKLSDVLRNLAQDLMRLVMRNVITAPLASAIGNVLSGGIPFLAKGGPARANSPYIVGEKGPELFVPGTTGTVIPNDRMVGAAGGGGTSVNIVYNIQSGVSRAELTPILENERKRLRAEIPDMVRRGGSYRAAFA